jgi:hypothetical protein
MIKKQHMLELSNRLEEVTQRITVAAERIEQQDQDYFNIELQMHGSLSRRAKVISALESSYDLDASIVEWLESGLSVKTELPLREARRLVSKINSTDHGAEVVAKITKLIH